MAIGATLWNFDVQLSDVDRGVYESFTLRAAQHPSETELYLVTRVLAYCLEYEEGIAFGGGVSTTAEPAVWVKDLTGDVRVWIEVGAPDAERVHHASKLADRVTVYTHRDAEKVIASWQGQTIHRGDDVGLRAFDRGFIESVASSLSRRSELSVSRTEGHLYVELNGTHFDTAVHEFTRNS